MNKEKETQAMSHSQAKKIARKQEIAKQKRDNAVNALIIYGIAAVVAAVILVGIGVGVYKVATKITPSSDYSAKLEDNGFIKGVNATSKLELCDYKNISVPHSEIAYTEEEFQQDVSSQLNAHKELSTDETLVAESGSELNINFVGRVDGEEFEGGTVDDYDLTIGSGMFIDGFEDQLIGAKAGDVVEVNVTFPDNYQNEELQNKPAVFEVTVNGIYQMPEFTDEFVKEYLSDVADSVDSYKAYLTETNEQQRKINWVDNYLQTNTNVKSYPASYVRNVQSTTMYDDQQSYEFMNQYYESTYGQALYQSFSEYTQMSDEAYAAQVKTTSESAVKAEMIYQAILESEGIQVTVDDIKAVEGDDYDTKVETYGPGYVAKDYIKNKALEIAVENATVQ